MQDYKNVDAETKYIQIAVISKALKKHKYSICEIKNYHPVSNTEKPKKNEEKKDSTRWLGDMSYENISSSTTMQADTSPKNPELDKSSVILEEIEKVPTISEDDCIILNSNPEELFSNSSGEQSQTEIHSALPDEIEAAENEEQKSQTDKKEAKKQRKEQRKAKAKEIKYYLFTTKKGRNKRTEQGMAPIFGIEEINTEQDIEDKTESTPKRGLIKKLSPEKVTIFETMINPEEQYELEFKAIINKDGYYDRVIPLDEGQEIKIESGDYLKKVLIMLGISIIVIGGSIYAIYAIII